MDEQLKETMRGILLDRYGLDINEARCSFSTQNYAFIPPNRDYMIRVSRTPQKNRREIISEMMWVDDLKQFKQTICEPNTSLRGNLLEEFEIDGVMYRASMFRIARGSVKHIGSMDPMLFICVGDLLGTIHHVSTDERELGVRFQRRSLEEQFAQRKERSFPFLSKEVQERITRIESQVNALSKEVGLYGICHGDFHHNNFLVEANNVWIFDFDSCCYAHYLYDVASFIQACFLHGYKVGEDCRKVLYEDILPYLKIGYELNKKCGEHYWDHLELFIAYRTAYSLMALAEIDECGVMQIARVKNFFNRVIAEDDVMSAMTAAAKELRGLS